MTWKPRDRKVINSAGKTVIVPVQRWKVASESPTCMFVVDGKTCDRECGLRSRGTGAKKYCYLHRTEGNRLDREERSRIKRGLEEKEAPKILTCEFRNCENTFEERGVKKYCSKTCRAEEKKCCVVESKETFYAEKYKARNAKHSEVVITKTDSMSIVEDFFKET